jgi:hypothetical protein
VQGKKLMPALGSEPGLLGFWWRGAPSGTLIADEHTVYDPALPSARRVAGIRGPMDEQGPNSSIARIVKARWYKTERGGLITIPPPAYEVDELGELVMTGDEAVTHAVGTVSRNSPSSVACTSSSRVGSAKG